jgi:GrpB-like predicted nucleotidyltransferase (UPF0157 family)
MREQHSKNRRVLLQTIDGEKIDVLVDWRKQKPLRVNQRIVYLQDWHSSKPWVEFFMDAEGLEVIYVTRDEYQKYENAPQWWILDHGTWVYETVIGRAFLTPLHTENDKYTLWNGRITKNGDEIVKATFEGGVGIYDGFFQAQTWTIDILGNSTIERLAKSLATVNGNEYLSMIEIIPYQPRWRDEFREIGGRIRAALGNLALRVDHIGSTSVPDLAAKDIIDVQVTLPDFEQLDEIKSRLEEAGFELRFFGIYDHAPAGWDTSDKEWEKAFFREISGRRVNLHVRAQGRANQRYALLFRDFLRDAPKVAAGYAAVKMQLAKYLDDITPYVEIKDPVVDIIIAQAEEWAERTGWVVGESDL